MFGSKVVLMLNTHNKLPKFAAKGAAGTNTHWASPNNVRICPLAKRYIFIEAW
jgi:hypothetical protein